MLKILNKIEFEDKCWVGLVDSSTWNSSEEDRIKAVTDIASITKGKLGFGKDKLIKVRLLNPDREIQADEHRLSLYHRLLHESVGKPSTPFEFIPVFKYIKASETVKYQHDYLRYGSAWLKHFCTNLRNDLEWYSGDEYNHSSDCDGFKVIVGRVPWKVISHLRTHRAFSWLVESSRNKRYLNEVEFWYPSWWNSEVASFTKERDSNLLTSLKGFMGYTMYKPEEATMELSDRRLVYFAMAAWKQDTNAWDNLFDVRGNKSGTMSITGITVDNIKQLIK